MRLLLFLYFATLTFLTLNPWIRPDSSPAVGNIYWDKIDHATAYALLAGLMLLAFKFCKPLWLYAIFVLLITSSIGLFLEFCQLWLTSNRMFSYEDAYANVFGALLGVTLFCCYRAFVNYSGQRT